MAVRVAVLASGGGSNLQALLDALGAEAPAHISRVISNRAGAGALDRARAAGLPALVLKDPGSAPELLAALDDAELVVLAGYLKLVPPGALARFRWRVINIHPALLPAYGGPGMYGRKVHEAVLAGGTRISGATVHYADAAYDRGPIITQWPVPVLAGDTAAVLAARVLTVEHRLLPAVVVALARLGLPDRPVRLRPAGNAFLSSDGPLVRLEVE